MTQATAILGLLAQTSIHAGTGSNTGVIDLPIQREGHNGYPCVFGSSMKGALRNHAELQHGKSKASVIYVFGPDTNGAGEHAGALIVSDARLLLLPIRSLTSQFKWVTCPDVLKRYQRDAQRFGLTVSMPDIKLSDEQACVHTGGGNTDLFLEEYRFSSCEQDLGNVIDSMAELMLRDDAQEALAKQLAIVSDTMFAHLCQHATPVNAHIAIDSPSKTVTGGALWYEETLPPETLLYIGLAANKVRPPDENKRKVDLPSDQSANWVLTSVIGLFKDKPWDKPWLQIGGNETVGMGWCAVTPITGDKA